jgi:hypothetical protein
MATSLFAKKPMQTSPKPRRSQSPGLASAAGLDAKTVYPAIIRFGGPLCKRYIPV